MPGMVAVTSSAERVMTKPSPSGAIVTAAAVVVQVAYEPPVWLQMLIWAPVTLAGVVASLRVAKGVLLTIEYRQAAREGRVRS